MDKKNDNDLNYKELKELLDRQLEIERIRKNKTSAWKIILYIFVGLFSVSFLGFACFMMYKQSFTMETLLAVLLSFFSIGLSIMFYIQSDRTSASFYKDSYQIMKDVAVTLGRIEAGFGEKLSAINSKIGSLENKKQSTQQELDEKQKEQEEIEKRLLQAKDNKDKQDLIDKIKKTENEIISLRNYLMRLENNKRDLELENNKIKRNLYAHNIENIYKNYKTIKDNDIYEKNNKLNEYVKYMYELHNKKKENKDIDE